MRHLAILILLALTGCAPLVKVEQPSQTGFILLEENQRVGQTFTGRYNGLDGIVLYLKPGDSEPGDGTLALSLRSNPQASDDLGSAHLALRDITGPGYYRLDFSPIYNSTNQDFFLETTITGSGSLFVAYGLGDSYLNGSSYLNGEPSDSQLSFRLAYDRSQVVSGLLREGLVWLARLIAAAWLFLLPGWGLAGLLWRGWRRLRWPEKLGVAAGLSVSLYPILFLWTSLVGLRQGAIDTWLLPLLGLIALLWGIWRDRRLQVIYQPQVLDYKSTNTHTPTHTIWPAIAYISIMALVIFTRFWTVRTLDVPMWGDSYQHTLIAQLLVDHRGLFDNWAPYADLQSFTYHFGFHTLVAVYHWLTGLNLAQATLWTGQILNILAVACLFPLAVRLGRSQWAGVLAVLVGGLFSSMPMFYVNWGRYTQLAGQVILPVAMFLAWELVNPALEAQSPNPEPERFRLAQPDVERGRNRAKPTRNLPVLLLASIALAGVALTHYRILIFLAVFIVTVAILDIRRERWRAHWISLVSCGALAGVLVLPWYIHIYGDKVMQLLVHHITTPAGQVSEATQQFNAIGNLSTYLPLTVWVMLGFSLVWALWKREKLALLIVIWGWLVLLAANPQWLRLPGTGAIGSFTVLIAAYIPASLLIGAAGGWLIETQIARLSKKAPAFLTLALATGFVVAVGLVGAPQRLQDIHIAQDALAVRPDLRAASWIQANTPQDAHFLVNSFFAFGNGLIAGSDGGLWLPLLAGRSTTLPPINYTLEKGPEPDFVPWTHALTAAIQAKGISSPDVVAMLKDRGITYVYIGQQQGRVNSPGPLITAEQMLNDPHFSLIYHQDRVYIFKVNL